MRVAVIDSGWSHDDPSERRVLAGVSFEHREVDGSIEIGTDAMDQNGHGTRVTRILLTLDPQVEVTPVRIFGRSLETSPLALVAALAWAAERRFDVVNLSVASTRLDARSAIYSVCSRLRDSGAVLVCATRNGFGDGLPAQFDNVIGVALRDGWLPCGDGAHLSPIQHRLFLPRGWAPRGSDGSMLEPLTSTSAATAVAAGFVSHALRDDPSASLEYLIQSTARRIELAIHERGPRVGSREIPGP
jgi:subtilisin